VTKVEGNAVERGVEGSSPSAALENSAKFVASCLPDHLPALTTAE
jgi:hypothetical protein